MSDQATPAESEDPSIGAALRDYLERVDRGESVDRDEFLARHPSIAGELRSFMADDDIFRKLAEESGRQDSAQDSTKPVALRSPAAFRPVSPALGPTSSLSGSTKLQGEFGRYKIVRTLGSGAMGTVYLAEDTQLQRSVALKTPHFTEDPTGEQLERFYREARAAGTLRHPNICPVFDIGQLDGTHYISMAYIEGRPLSAFIETGKPQSERQILIAIRKLALALQEAHDHGVVHRDLKPANIMVDKKSEPIIMDFGLARQARCDDEIRLTQRGIIIGTPAFMSPEQVEGESDQIGPASDQYSLGVILYEMLTGDLPFRGSPIAVMGQILTNEPVLPSQLRADLDPRIETVCRKMMAKKTSDRFHSMSAAAAELETILRNPRPAPKAKPTSSATIASTTATHDPSARAQYLPSFKPGNRSEQSTSTSSQNPPTVKPIALGAKTKPLSGKDLASLEELARKCYSRRDYDKVIQMIERVPEARRSQSLQDLLEKSRGTCDVVAFLISEIDEAERLADGRSALKNTNELLTIKPGHPRGLAVLEKFSRSRKQGPAKTGTLGKFTRPWREGGWIPWGVLAGAVAFFGVFMAVIAIYRGRTAILVDVRDPGITVAVSGSTITVVGPATEKVTVEPGEQELTVLYRDLKFTSKNFTLQKGDKKTVTISVVDKNVVAKVGDEELSLASTRVHSPVPLLVAPFHKQSAKNGQDQWASYLEIPVKLNNSLGMEFSLIPAGEFTMGAPVEEAENDQERPQHKVRITHPFYLGAHEVTKGQFAEFANATGYKTEAEGVVLGGRRFNDDGEQVFDRLCNWRYPGFVQDDRHPVVEVTFHDAAAFCKWLSQKEGQAYRLPTEAEWEYACRAGTTTRWYCGDDPEELAKFGNVSDASWAKKFGKGAITADDGYIFTAPVGSFQPNGFGLFDMHGNVCEWVQDWGGTGYYAQSPTDDPTGVAAGTDHITRGGAMDTVVWCRSAVRDMAAPSDRCANLGFRVVRTIPVVPREAANVRNKSAAAGETLLVAPFDQETAASAQRAWADRLAIPAELINTIRMQLRLIPPGEFQMGSNDKRVDNDARPVHRVRITNPFYLGVYEVTQEEYKRLMGSNPSLLQDDLRLPVDSVSAAQAREFTRRLSELPDEKQAGRNYRLPTEAEWEYACRAGTETLFYFGDTISSRQANFATRDSNFTTDATPGPNRSVPVGSYPPNAFGLYDMHGNVVEMCEDHFDVKFYARSSVDDPKNPDIDNGWNSVVRGGSWFRPASPSAFRYPRNLATIDGDYGFRIVLSISKPAVAAPPAGANGAPPPTQSQTSPGDGPDKRAISFKGMWRIRDDELVQISRGHDACEIQFGRLDWTDYDFSAEVMRETGNRMVAFSVRCADPANQWLFLIGNWRNHDHGLQIVKSGVYDTPQKHPGQLVNNLWYKASVKVRGGRIEAYLNGNREFDAEEPRLPAGRVGFRTGRSIFHFRNIRVTRPDGTILWEGLPQSIVNNPD